MKKTFESSPSYFGAANSFQGFKSHFDRIFIPEEYERIYILKGGPGTGKSTLMKRITKTLTGSETEINRIYCSSDPNSLDAVIISKKSKKIAIVDGTSPHTMDAEYPGAVEAIVNLGEGFDTGALSKRKSEIIHLAKRKKEAYKMAYGYLEACGKIHSQIWHLIENSSVNTEAERISDQVLQYQLFRKKYSEATDNYWLGAFCKNGYVRLNIPCIEKEYISIKGDGFSEQVVMNLVFDRLISEGAVDTVARSALIARCIDAIITDSCIISADNIGGIVFDTSPLSRSFGDDYYPLYDSYNRILSLAKESLEVASEEHFKLEDIYSANIDFTVNERIIKALEGEICDILF